MRVGFYPSRKIPDSVYVPRRQQAATHCLQSEPSRGCGPQRTVVEIEAIDVNVCCHAEES